MEKPGDRTGGMSKASVKQEVNMILDLQRRPQIKVLKGFWFRARYACYIDQRDGGPSPSPPSCCFLDLASLDRAGVGRKLRSNETHNSVKFHKGRGQMALPLLCKFQPILFSSINI